MGDCRLNKRTVHSIVKDKEGFESVSDTVIWSDEGNITMSEYNGERINKNLWRG